MNSMRVLMLLKTSGLEYDDRIRKESKSIAALKSSVLIVVLEYANKREEFQIYPNVRAKTLRLRTRKLFRRGSGLLFKTLELYILLIIAVLKNRSHIIWIHEQTLSGLIPFVSLLRKIGFVNRIIWDQHEVPHTKIITNPTVIGVFTTLCNLTDGLVVANIQRKNLLLERTRNKIKVPIHVLQNIPDREFIQLPKEELPLGVSQWLNGSPFILAQGGSSPNRYFEELIQAVTELPEIKLIVVGPYQEEQLHDIRLEYGSRIEKLVYFTGFIPQLEMTPFIDHALTSIILYKPINENQLLCAPNRLYQAVARGIPVVVGSNPPMAEFVKTNECGLVLPSDGREVRDIQKGILLMIEHHEEFRNNAVKIGQRIRWESQEDVVKRILGIKI